MPVPLHGTHSSPNTFKSCDDVSFHSEGHHHLERRQVGNTSLLPYPHPDILWPSSAAIPDPGLSPTSTSNIRERYTQAHINRFHGMSNRLQPNTRHLKGLLDILAVEPPQSFNHEFTDVDQFLLPKPEAYSTLLTYSPRNDALSRRVRLPNISYVLRGSARYPDVADYHCPLCPSPDCNDSEGRAGCDTSTQMTNALFSIDAATYTPLCEPLSTWIAQHIWSVATTGMSLSPDFVGLKSQLEFPAEPLSVLAESISSLLLSTLLQPSVIVLSLYYISRLPAYIGLCALDHQPKSTISQFKVALSSVDTTLHKSPVTKALYASFKLFVLGAILSNKVLDDHVFTLKTWQEVSGIPLEVLNKLEWLSLDILDHKLYVDPQSWEHWVGNLKHYHHSLPVTPSADLHSRDPSYQLVRCMLQKLASSRELGASGTCTNPLFLGINQRLVERIRERVDSDHTEPYGLDLDEDGPLREEYIPRRHSRLAGGVRAHCGVTQRWSNSPGPPHISTHLHGCQILVGSTDPMSWPSTPMDTIPCAHISALPYSSCRTSCADGSLVSTHNAAYLALDPSSCPSVGVPNIEERNDSALCDYFSRRRAPICA